VSQSSRALSFGAAADAYDRYRPSPPPEVLDWALPARATDVLDMGAGTGALTRRLLERGPGKVVAAEPDPRMLAVLLQRTPDALVVGAVAEALPFAAHRFDAVVVSSAWHWMEPTRTLTEVSRVLRPGGTFAVMWSGPRRDIEWVGRLLGRGDRQRAPDHRPHQFESPPGPPFGDPEKAVFTWSMPMTRDELVGLSGTYSGVLVRSAEQRAELLQRVAAHLEGGVSANATVDVPMGCRCWRMTVH